ncbi:hypothetical protein M407DRAFT_32563 [Tulasnella calospora MUT 4182]|uniref:Uncharacterized protein n=1 Tax=Tulasnella calospora MUT 4182 TaxID=1051891 RepID=A0A0C3L8B6_9AGAM|nr:hypothetical protein M407DRAFT_32563 [Tulasnella calospora MUT 4182]
MVAASDRQEKEEATLLSAVVVTLFSTTYSTNTTAGFRTANALFATSLVLSLATGVASFLAMEWLAWSSSQELRSASVLYRMMRTAVRSGLMHSAIFSFFTGLLVLLWEVTPVSVCIMPTIISISFGLYYVAATVRPIYMTGWKGTGQFDAVDVRGLRVQVWTPFSVGTQRVANYIWATVLGPLQRGIQQLSPSLRHRESTTMDIEAQVDSLAAFKITKG